MESLPLPLVIVTLEPLLEIVSAPSPPVIAVLFFLFSIFKPSGCAFNVTNSPLVLTA